MNRVSLLTNKICSIDKIKQFNYHTNIARDFFVRRIDKGDVKLNNLPYKYLTRFLCTTNLLSFDEVDAKLNNFHSF